MRIILLTPCLWAEIAGKRGKAEVSKYPQTKPRKSGGKGKR